MSANVVDSCQECCNFKISKWRACHKICKDRNLKTILTSFLRMEDGVNCLHLCLLCASSKVHQVLQLRPRMVPPVIEVCAMSYSFTKDCDHENSTWCLELWKSLRFTSRFTSRFTMTPVAHWAFRFGRFLCASPLNRALAATRRLCEALCPHGLVARNAVRIHPDPTSLLSV